MIYQRRQFLMTLLGVCAVCLGGGCAYRLGPTNGQIAGDKSIEITRFKNQTLEPRLSEYLMSPLRRAVQQDGTFSLCTERDSSGYILEGIITHFERTGVGSLPKNVVVHVDEYITIVVDVTLRERATDKIILQQSFSGSTVFPISSDQTSAERRNIPAAMENLARDIVSIIGDGKIRN